MAPHVMRLVIGVGGQTNRRSADLPASAEASCGREGGRSACTKTKAPTHKDTEQTTTCRRSATDTTVNAELAELAEHYILGGFRGFSSNHQDVKKSTNKENPATNGGPQLRQRKPWLSVCPGCAPCWSSLRTGCEIRN